MGTGVSRHNATTKQSATGSDKHTTKVGKNKIDTSKIEVTDFTDEEEEEVPYNPNLGTVEKLTDQEKQLLETTWIRIENDAERIGAITFINLFEKNPGVKDRFIPFKSIDVQNERYNKALRNHGLRVLKTVGKMIHRIREDESKMINIVRATGRRHLAYSADATLIDMMCPHFVKAIEGTLGESWTADVESAYNHLFAILSLHMKESLLIAQHEDHKLKLKKTKKQAS